MVLAGVVSASAAALGGCILFAAGAGVGGGYALTQERSFSDTAKDAGISAQITQSWKQYNLKLSEDLNNTVYVGDVLITGVVPTDDWRAEAVKRAWAVEGVKNVYDEIQLGPDEGFMQDMGDATITSKLKTQLVADGDVKSINYSITTVKGVVYLMGSARSDGELQRVVDHARTIGNVRNVQSFVHIRVGAPAEAQAGSGPAAAPAPPSSVPSAPPPAAGDQVSTPPPQQKIDVAPLQ
jgi:osmotically-inducible protein OsmY